MTELSYRVIRSARKTISIRITPAGEVEVRCPNRMSRAAVLAFVNSKSDWIQKHLAKRAENPTLPPFSGEERNALVNQARVMIPPRVEYYARQMGVTVGRIAIRSQHTRWGSCSAKGNLNFNCLLALTPPEVLDYVVVHELCHRKELNHSPRFWAEVEKILPDWKAQRNWLKENGTALISRLPK